MTAVTVTAVRAYQPSRATATLWLAELNTQSLFRIVSPRTAIQRAANPNAPPPMTLPHPFREKLTSAPSIYGVQYPVMSQIRRHGVWLKIMNEKSLMPTTTAPLCAPPFS